MDSNSSMRRIFSYFKRTFQKWLIAAAVALVAVFAFHLFFVTERGICSATVNFSYDGIESGFDPDGNRFDPTEMKSAEFIRQAAEAVRVKAAQEKANPQEDTQEEAQALTEEDTQEEAQALTEEDTQEEAQALTEGDAQEEAQALTEEDTQEEAQALTEEETQRIQDALEIRGAIPEEAFDNIVNGASIYGDKLSELKEVGDTAYFPAQYAVILRYIDAGFTAKQAELFLNELLNAYEKSFYEKYGYNPALQEVVSSVDYDAYDYIDAIEILKSRLSSVRAYLVRLMERDNTRFISKETGYSFADFLGAIDTIQAEDIQWLNSYVISANISKDIGALTDYYQYKIDNDQRALEQQESRLYTLSQSIESYAKTNALMPGVGAGNGEDNGAPYEFSQPSEMYDSLINQKIECQTGISETQERIALFQRRIERLRNAEASGKPEILTTRLEATRTKLDQLLERLRLTADEFFKTVEMKRAFQTLEEPKAQGLGLISAVKSSKSDVLMAEAALFGVYVLSALTAFLPAKRKRSPEEYASASQDRAAK